MGFVQRIAGLHLIVAMVALVVMGSVTAADVFLKYVFTAPISGAFDLVESLLPVVIFHGLPAALLRRQNIAIDLVDGLAGPAGTRALIGVADLVMLAMLCLFTWAAIDPAMQAFDYGDRKLELGLPLYAVWGAAILGMAGSALAAAAALLRGPPAKVRAHAGATAL